MERQGEGHVTIEAKIGVMYLQANDGGQIPEGMKRQGRILT